MIRDRIRWAHITRRCEDRRAQRCARNKSGTPLRRKRAREEEQWLADACATRTVREAGASRKNVANSEKPARLPGVLGRSVVRAITDTRDVFVYFSSSSSHASLKSGDHVPARSRGARYLKKIYQVYRAAAETRACTKSCVTSAQPSSRPFDPGRSLRDVSRATSPFSSPSGGRSTIRTFFPYVTEGNKAKCVGVFVRWWLEVACNSERRVNTTVAPPVCVCADESAHPSPPNTKHPADVGSASSNSEWICTIIMENAPEIRDVSPALRFIALSFFFSRK